MKISTAFCMAIGLSLAAPFAHGQAKITIVSEDSPGLGLNDTTPALPDGGNPGTTLGQQRAIVFQYAADIWGALLRSAVEIHVDASFKPLRCDAIETLAGLSQGKGTVTADRIFPDGSKDLFYPAVLANAIAGSDFTPERSDMFMSFNSNIDLPSCQVFVANGWYYGLRGNGVLNPERRSNFLNVALHEMAHGLGFKSGATVFLGVTFNYPTPFDKLVWSNKFSKSVSDLSLSELTEAFVIDGGNIWNGKAANKLAGLMMENRDLLVQSSPVAAKHAYNQADYGASDLSSMKGEVVLVQDEVGQDGIALHQGCDGANGQPRIANADALAGKLVLVDEGGCSKTAKALSAQRHGAIGVVIANDVAQMPLFARAERDSIKVTLPVITVTHAVGAALRADKSVVVSGFEKVPGQFYGLDSTGKLRLFSPGIYQVGTTLHHLDGDARPKSMMSPYEFKSMRSSLSVDVVLEMFEEMGWPTNRNGTAKLNNCETGIPVYRDGFIPGANLIAHSKMCATAYSGSRSQQLRCMNDQINWLHSQSMLSSPEVAKARQCIAKL